ncbi:MAG: cell division protein FtsB [Halieaceae bacterium MED-G27]|jgi:cell division protein FtsB|nr:MAG: cell division protein FtsB [Halieaceae bacterium MED-G27]
MRLMLALLGLLLLLQYRLWLGEGGIIERASLEQRVADETELNSTLRERNEALTSQVLELQQGEAMLEAVAREDLGLVQEGEEFYLFVDKTDQEFDQ